MKLLVIGLLVLGASAELGDNYRRATEMIIQSWFHGEPFVVNAFTEDAQGYGTPPEFGGPWVGHDGLRGFLADLAHVVQFDLKDIHYEIKSVDSFRRSVFTKWNMGASVVPSTKQLGTSQFELIYHFEDDSEIPLCSGWTWIHKDYSNPQQYKTQAHLKFEELHSAFWSGDLDGVRSVLGSATITWHGPEYNLWAATGPTNIDRVLAEWVPQIYMYPTHNEIIHSTDDVIIVNEFLNMSYLPNGRYLGNLHSSYHLTNGVITKVDWSYIEEPTEYAWFPAAPPPEGFKVPKGEL